MTAGTLTFAKEKRHPKSQLPNGTGKNVQEKEKTDSGGVIKGLLLSLD